MTAQFAYGSNILYLIRRKIYVKRKVFRHPPQEHL